MEQNRKVRREHIDLHGDGGSEREVYAVTPIPDDYWAAVTDVPCPVHECSQTVCWYEAGYVPGYRVCMAPLDGAYAVDTIRHCFQADGDVLAPTLQRDHERERE